MVNRKIFTIPFRRKRQDKTNYKKRLGLLKSGSLRLVVRRFNRHITAQLIKYGDNGDSVLESTHSKNLEKYGWKLNTGNIPAAYLTGLLLGVKAKGKVAILDLGLQTPIPGSKIYAVLKGAIDGGLKINASDEVFPTEERISGKHMKDVKDQFEKTKEKILSEKK